MKIENCSYDQKKETLYFSKNENKINIGGEYYIPVIYLEPGERGNGIIFVY